MRRDTIPVDLKLAEDLLEVFDTGCLTDKGYGSKIHEVDPNFDRPKYSEQAEELRKALASWLDRRGLALVTKSEEAPE